jgi:hypothetical protein
MKVNRRAALSGLALFRAGAQSTPPLARASPEAISAFWEPVDRQMVERLNPPPSAHVLDAAAGAATMFASSPNAAW